MIFFWEPDTGTADSGRAWCRACVWKRDLGEGVLRNESVHFKCVRSNGRSCYNIGLCCGERWSPAVARYSTALHLQ